MSVFLRIILITFAALVSSCSTSIFLSQEKIDYSYNKKYPENLQKEILEFKSKLNRNDAVDILSRSLTNPDLKSEKIFICPKCGDGDKGLIFSYNQAVIDRTDIKKSYGGTTVKTTYHFELESEFIPFSDIKYVRIIEYNPKNIELQIFARPVTEVHFNIEPDANKIHIIASMLYLCENLKSTKHFKRLILGWFW